VNRSIVVVVLLLRQRAWAAPLFRQQRVDPGHRCGQDGGSAVGGRISFDGEMDVSPPT
jgi:hypothetical protein